jgi:hypothetical protein
MSDIVERLRTDLSSGLSASLGDTKDAADEIERLREKCNNQAMVLRRLTPDKYPGVYFIHGELGEKDQNGMPEKIMVVPAYGCDWSQIYERTEKTVGPEW